MDNVAMNDLISTTVQEFWFRAAYQQRIIQGEEKMTHHSQYIMSSSSWTPRRISYIPEAITNVGSPKTIKACPRYMYLKYSDAK